MKRAMAILLLVVTACSSSAGAGSPPRKVSVGWADKGRTVRVNQDDSVVVRLNSLYWQFRPVKGDVLTSGPRVVHAGHSRVPGTGAGTVAVTFHAVHKGTATITAGRRSCGEALRCIGGQGAYRVTIVVG